MVPVSKRSTAWAPRPRSARSDASGLRGRGGAGFPTAIKLGGVASAVADRKFVVANVSEGEPGTFKDRWMLQNNPYSLLEGITIAGMAVGAEQAFIGIKHKHHAAIDALERAAVEMVDAGMIGQVPITIVRGPDVYLFGEEKGDARSHRGPRSRNLASTRPTCTVSSRFRDHP